MDEFEQWWANDELDGLGDKDLAMLAWQYQQRKIDHLMKSKGIETIIWNRDKLND